MKIILTHPSMAPEAEQLMIDWITGIKDDPESKSPLKYAVNVEVER